MSTLKQFYDWVSRQSGEYEVADNCNCPMANFAREVYGLKFPNARTMSVDEAEGPNGTYPAHILKEAAVEFEVAVYHTIRNFNDYTALQEALASQYLEVLS